jgi:hypothetical protein
MVNERLQVNQIFSKCHILLQRIHHRRRLGGHVLTLLAIPLLFILLLPTRGHSLVPIPPEMPSVEGKVCFAMIEWTWRPHVQDIGGHLPRE